jgi:hypothetical protein
MGAMCPSPTATVHHMYELKECKEEILLHLCTFLMGLFPKIRLKILAHHSCMQISLALTCSHMKKNLTSSIISHLHIYIYVGSDLEITSMLFKVVLTLVVCRKQPFMIWISNFKNTCRIKRMYTGQFICSTTCWKNIILYVLQIARKVKENIFKYVLIFLIPMFF